jgi:hypothetical protein
MCSGFVWWYSSSFYPWFPTGVVFEYPNKVIIDFQGIVFHTALSDEPSVFLPSLFGIHSI